MDDWVFVRVKKPATCCFQSVLRSWGHSIVETVLDAGGACDAGHAG